MSVCVCEFVWVSGDRVGVWLPNLCLCVSERVPIVNPWPTAP